MRFDLVVNNLAGHAWTETRHPDGERRYARGGRSSTSSTSARRSPASCSRPATSSTTRSFNVGDNAQNYQIREIAEIISATFPGCELTVGDSSGDNRNYRANFDKIHSQLPGFRCRDRRGAGAVELLRTFRGDRHDTELFEFRGHTRIKQIKHLLETGQIDDRFFWTISPNGS